MNENSRVALFFTNTWVVKSMDAILNRITSFLANNDNIDEERLEVIRYGIEILLLKVLFFIASMLVGVLLHSFWECLLFTLSFSAIRSMAGGYHADTRTKCFIQSMFMLILVLAILKLIQGNLFGCAIVIGLSFVAAVIIWLTSPIDTANKRLTNEERKILKIKSRLILIIETVICISTYLLNYGKVAYSIMVALISTAVLLIIGGSKSTKQIS